MSAPEPRYVDYVKEAFHASPRVPGLGNLPLNWLALAGFATLGILHPGFWLVGAGLELGYLAILSNNKRFQSFVRGKRIAQAQAMSIERAMSAEEDRIAHLDPSVAERYLALRRSIANAPDGAPGTAGLIADVARDGLATLQRTFLDLAVAREGLAARADPAVRRRAQDDLDREIRTLEGLPPDGDPRIRRSVQGTIDILQKRLENLDAAARDVAYLDSELRRIEQQVALVLEEAALADDPAKLTRRIDQVTGTFDDTREWMRRHRDLLDEIDPDDGPVGPPPGAIAARAKQRR